MKKLKTTFTGYQLPSIKEISISFIQITLACLTLGVFLWGVKLLTELVLKG